MTLPIAVLGVGLHRALTHEHVQIDMHRICEGKHMKETYIMKFKKKKKSLSKPPLQLSVFVNNRLYVCIFDLDTGWQALVPQHLLQRGKFTQDISYKAQMGCNQAIL